MKIYLVTYTTNQTTPAQELVYFVTPSVDKLLSYIKLNYVDWTVLTLSLCGEVFDVVDGRIVSLGVEENDE